MQRPRDQPMTAWEKLSYSKWRSGSDSLPQPKPAQRFVEWNGYFLLASAVHSSRTAFRNSTHGLS